MSAADRLTDERAVVLEIAALGRRAQNDPGHYVPRLRDEDDDYERLDRWQARALDAAVDGFLAARGVRAPGDTTADRDALGMAWDDGNATGLDGWVGPGRGTEPDPEGIDARERYLDRALAARPAPAEEVDPRDPLGIVTPNPKPTCPVPGFGRDHLWATGAFYVGSRLIQSDDYVMCGSCGQIEYDVPEEPTRPAPDTLADRVQALADSWAAEAADGRDSGGHPLLVQTCQGHADSLRALVAGRPDASPEGGA